MLHVHKYVGWRAAHSYSADKTSPVSWKVYKHCHLSWHPQQFWEAWQTKEHLPVLQASIIVFLLALVIATGVILTAGFGGRYAILDLVRHSNLAFSSLCSSSASS